MEQTTESPVADRMNRSARRRPAHPGAHPRHRPRAVHRPGVREDVAASDRRAAGVHQGGDLLPLRQQGRHPHGPPPAAPRVRPRGTGRHGRRSLARAWGRLLDGLIDQMLAQRALFILHERNQAAIEELHRRRTTRPTRGHPGPVPPGPRPTRSSHSRPRVRMACAFGRGEKTSPEKPSAPITAPKAHAIRTRISGGRSSFDSAWRNRSWMSSCSAQPPAGGAPRWPPGSARGG